MDSSALIMIYIALQGFVGDRRATRCLLSVYRIRSAQTGRVCASGGLDARDRLALEGGITEGESP